MTINKLANGLTVIQAEIKGVNTVTALVMIGTGSKYEGKRVSGVSHFLEHMFFKGTKKRPNTLAIASELDGIGADYNAFTGKEYTGYWVKAKQDKLSLALDTVSDMLINSRFEKREIEREKGVIIEELNMYRDNPMMYIEDLFEECLYGDTPAGRDTIGTKNTIKNISRRDIVEYWTDQYSSHNTFVVLAGNYGGQEKALGLVKKYFSHPEFSQHGRNFREKDKVQEAQARPNLKVLYKKTDQAHIMLGVRGFDYNYKNWRAIKMLSVILGGSMSSRLFINLRERSGLAYYVHTAAEFYTDSGYLATRAGVPVGMAGKAIKIILAEYKRIAQTLVSPAELKLTRDYLTGKTALQLEASDNMAYWYGRQAVMVNTIERIEGKSQANKVVTPSEEAKKIRSIGADAIRQEAKRIFRPQNLNLALIGPFKDKDKKKFQNLLSG